MTLNRIILFLFISFFVAGLPHRAQAALADTFNMKELSRDYALSCKDQAAMRHANLLPPYFPGRPAAFLNERETLALYSPQLTAAERRNAEKLFASVPAYALPMAWRGGAVYVFVRHGIVEAVPALSVEDNWFQDYGLYMEVERRLYLPFEKGEGLHRKADGTYAARKWIVTKRDQFRVINHETGHMIDNMLGGYSLDAKGEDGQFRLSNRPDYVAAVKADLARLASSKRQITLQKIHKLGYYMPVEFDGVRMGIQPEQRARREVFAELWAENQGYSSNKLSTAYPSAFNVVKRFAAFLKAQDAAAPVHCKLE